MGVLESQLERRVLRLTLNRPQKRNALNEELSRALLAALEAADDDGAVGAIVLTGNGGAFCAGMDLREVLDAQVAARMAPLHERLFTMIGRMRKPVVAAIQGAAIAGGTGVAANAHIVIAADDAQFGLTEIRIGLWPVLIFPACALAMGERRTTELALTGRLFMGKSAGMERGDKGGGIGGAHERLDDEHRMGPGATRSYGIGRGGYAAFAHGNHVAGELGNQAFAQSEVGGEDREVAIVDADDAGPLGHGAGEFGLGVNLEERVEARGGCGVG